MAGHMFLVHYSQPLAPKVHIDLEPVTVERTRCFDFYQTFLMLELHLCDNF